MRAAAAIALMGVLAACSAAATPKPSASAAPSYEFGLPAPQDVEAAGALVIEAAPAPDWVTLAGGSAWVAGVGAGIGRYNALTGAVLAEVPVSGQICLAMDTGFESVWAGNCTAKTLVRIDERGGGVLATIALPADSIHEESSVAVGDNAVWVLAFSGRQTLIRVDPVTNTVVASYDAPPSSSALRAGAGGLWVTSAENGTVTHVNPADGSIVAVIPVFPDANFLAFGEGAVWVLNNGTGTVSRIDPATDQVVGTFHVSEGRVDGGDIAFGGGYVWARITDQLVAQLDPMTNDVVARYGPASGSGSVAADDDALWISAHDVHTIWRLPLS